MNTRLFLCSSLLATPILFVATATAQAPVLTVDPPVRIYESEIGPAWTISGRYILDAYPTVTVHYDGVDVTSLVAWNWSAETFVDINQDGVLEGFLATLTVDTLGLGMDDDGVLRVDAHANGAGGSAVASHADVTITGHARIGAAPARYDAYALPQTLLAHVTLSGVAPGTSYSLTIYKDGVDVTPGVTMNQVLLSSAPTVGVNGLVDEYHDVFVDTASLGSISPATVVDMVLTTSFGGETYQSGAGIGFGGDPDPVPGENEKVCDLLNSLWITQGDANSPVQMAVTDKEAIRAALEGLQKAIRDCQSSGEQSGEYKIEGPIDCGNGNVVNVCICIGGNGDSTNTSGGTADAGSGSKTNALVIAIGGNASGDDSIGGPADARGGDGSVAIAMGGTGAGPGPGGRGSVIMPGNGQGHALGGRGGSGGGSGGNGWGDFGGGSGGGSGQAAGGPGGHGGDGTTGGHGGGGGVRTTTGGVCEQKGGPQGGGAGGDDKHGSGACASAGSNGTCSSTPGHSVDNE